MLMAAGLGKRLKPFTDYCPKPLIPLLGVPTIQFAVDNLQHFGVEQAVVNVHQLPDKMNDGLGKLDWQNVQYQVSDETKLLLGSGGGVAKATAMLGQDPFFLLNADVVTEIDLRALADRHQNLKAQRGVKMTLALMKDASGTKSYSQIETSDDGIILSASREKKGSTFYIGTAVVEPDVLSKLSKSEPSDMFTDVMLPLIESKQLGFYEYQGIWFDVGSPFLWFQSHLELLDLLDQGKMPSVVKDRVLLVNDPVGEKSLKLKTNRHSWSSKESFCYWGSPVAPPESFGPEAVVYGDHPKLGQQSRFIELDGAWEGF